MDHSGRLLLARLRSSKGQSLIEVMIMISIVAILTMGFLTFVSGLFNSEVKTAQAFAEQTSAQSALQWLNARLSPGDKVGVLANSGSSIDPLTVAQDQIVFSDADSPDPSCYRVAYAKPAQDTYISSASLLVMSSATTCTQDSDMPAQMKPVRGPTGTDPGFTGQARCSGNSLASGVDPMFDIAPGTTLTCGTNTFPGPTALASNIQATPPSGSYGPNPLVVFQFENSTDTPLLVGNGTSSGPAGPDQYASASSANTWYTTTSNRGPGASGNSNTAVFAVNSTLYQGPTTGSSGQGTARTQLSTLSVT